MNALDLPAKTLEEALIHWGDPAQVAEMQRLRDLGCDASIVPYEDPKLDQLFSRYRQLRSELKGTIVEMLRAGQLLATGHDSRATADAEPVKIFPDRWRVLEPDFRSSSVVGGGLEITGILVKEQQGAMPSCALSLVLNRPHLMLHLNDEGHRLTRYTFELLWLLAKAAADGSGLVSIQAIQRRIFGSADPPAKTAHNDLVRELRERLDKFQVIGTWKPREMVQTRPGEGLLLALPPRSVITFEG